MGRIDHACVKIGSATPVTDLVRQALLQTERPAQQRQDDHEAREAGHHQRQHGQQPEQRHDDQDLRLDRELGGVAAVAACR